MRSRLLLLSAILVGAMLATASADLLDRTPSFQVTRLFYEYNDAVLAASTGDGFVVVWDEFYTLEGPHVVIGKRVGPDGETSGRFAISDGVNYFETSDDPSLAALPGGGFIVSWLDHDSPTVIRGQRFDAEANADGAEVVISEPGLAQSSPQVAAAGDGSFLIAWRAGTGENAEVRAMRYDSDGVPAPDTIVPSEGASADVGIPLSASGGSDGSFVVSWRAAVTYETGAAGGYYPFTRFETRGRKVSPSGTPSGSIFDAAYASGGKVRHLSNDDFVVAWSGSYYSYDVSPGPLNAYARIHSNGDASTLQLSERSGYDDDGPNVALAPVPNDGFIVAWSHHAAGYPQPVDEADVLVRHMGNDGSPRGSALPLHFDFRSSSPLAPAVAVSGDRTLLAWNDGYEIRGQILDIVEAVSCGDANEDGKISSVDALITLSSSVGIGYCSRLLCDADGDRSTDSTDALLILRAAIGSIAEPNCTPTEG